MSEINKKSARAKVLEAVKEDGYALSKANIKYRDDKEIVSNAIKNWPGNFELASEKIKKDKKMVTYAFNLDPITFIYAHSSLKKDISFIKKLEKINDEVWLYVDKKLRNKREQKIKKEYLDREKKEKLYFKKISNFVKKNKIKEINDLFKFYNHSKFIKNLDRCFKDRQELTIDDVLVCFCPKNLNEEKFLKYYLECDVGDDGPRGILEFDPNFSVSTLSFLDKTGNLTSIFDYKGKLLYDLAIKYDLDLDDDWENIYYYLSENYGDEIADEHSFCLVPGTKSHFMLLSPKRINRKYLIYYYSYDHGEDGYDRAGFEVIHRSTKISKRILKDKIIDKLNDEYKKNKSRKRVKKKEIPDAWLLND